MKVEEDAYITKITLNDGSGVRIPILKSPPTVQADLKSIVTVLLSLIETLDNRITALENKK